MTINAIGNISSQISVSQTNSPASSLRQNVKGLETALLNGDLSGAQSAFASLQQAVSGAQGSANSNSVMSQLGQSNSPLGQDLQAVSSALGANDISGAQKAFAKLQQDMESAFQANGASHTHHGHHSHHAKANTDASATQDSPAAALNNLLQSMSSTQSTGSSTSDLLNALQSLANSNPKVAGDLITLIKDMNSGGTLIKTSA
jgi:hypothetical protein